LSTEHGIEPPRKSRTASSSCTPIPSAASKASPKPKGVCAYSLLELLAMVDECHDEPMIEPGRLQAIRAKLHAQGVGRGDALSRHSRGAASYR
jgi:hypothetical protein